MLALLLEGGAAWSSGEELSRRMGVSRTAIWKQMEGLRAAGYEIEAVTRLGYRLLARPDAVTALEVLSGLRTRRFAREIAYRESVGSTNEWAKELAREGAAEGLLVIADEQTTGKGRLGRSWATPRGAALAMSLVLRPELPPHEAPRITLASAVAVAEGVRESTGLAAGIKWPNDVLLHGKKFCGILTEMEAEMERTRFVVCGIGINVNLTPSEIPSEVREKATSLQIEAGCRVLRAPLAAAVMSKFESAYDDLVGGRFEEVLARWRALSVTLGRPVRVTSMVGGEVVTGVAEDLDETGALLVRDESGQLHRVVAGEVTLRGEV